MAREVATDFIHSMRFQVVTNDGGRPGLSPDGRADAGFSMMSTPEATVEAVEYREGTFVYTRKYPGLPTMNDLSMSRGVARGDSKFWDWLRIVIEGSGEYRQDLDINHYHRDTALTRANPVVSTAPDANLTQIPVNEVVPARVYHISQAFPTRHKVAADLDATASEISIMELDLSFEYFEVEEPTA
jgi:phage tail-like protein